jgi:hypothetical protein
MLSVFLINIPLSKQLQILLHGSHVDKVNLRFFLIACALVVPRFLLFCSHAIQDITDLQKIQGCLAVAQRGLADLQSYLPDRMNAGGTTNISLTLKGATTE